MLQNKHEFMACIESALTVFMGEVTVMESNEWIPRE